MDDLTRRIQAPAKLNLRLKVVGRRPDGYHELVSIMAPVSLWDLLELHPVRSGKILLTCRGLSVPGNEKNLVYRAAEAFITKASLRGGISIRLTKHIPVAAGLGGGSSDAAATLRAMNEIWSQPLSFDELAALAVRLGADVPFFLTCRTSLATGIGEVLEPIRKWPPLWYVIVTPPLEISTAWVYRNLKLELTTGEYDSIVNRLQHHPPPPTELLENDLETVTALHYPVIVRIKKALLEAGASGTLMSGSGPSVFGLFESKAKAEKAKQKLKSQDLGRLFIVHGI